MQQADRDRAGWDFQVDFEVPPLVQGVTLDGRRAPVSCLVQVKTIWQGQDQVRMRLSSAENLAKALKPSFVYVIEMDDNVSCIGAYILHLLDNNLSKVLHRLRLEHGRGHLSVNKAYLTFRPPVEGVRLDPTGEALRSALTECCRNDTQIYVNEKISQLNNLGYDLRRFRLQATLCAANMDTLADGFLGLVAFQGSSLRASEVRYDIPLPLEHFGPVSEVTIRIEPAPVADCIIRVRSGDLGRPAVFPGQCFAPALPNLPVGYHRVLFRTAFFDIKILRDNVEFEVPLDRLENTRHELVDWRNYFRLLVLMAMGDTTLELDTPRGTITVSATCNRPDVALAEYHKTLMNSVDQAIELFDLAGAKAPAVFLQDLLEWAAQVRGAHAILKGDVNLERFEALLQGVCDSIRDDSMKEAFAASASSRLLFASFVVIAESCLAYAAVVSANVENAFDEMQWRVSNVKPVRVRSISSKDDDFGSFVKGLQAELGIEAAILIPGSSFDDC